MIQHMWLFMCVLVLNSGHLCVHSKHFTNCGISPVPGLSWSSLGYWALLSAWVLVSITHAHFSQLLLFCLAVSLFSIIARGPRAQGVFSLPQPQNQPDPFFAKCESRVSQQTPSSVWHNTRPQTQPATCQSTFNLWKKTSLSGQCGVMGRMYPMSSTNSNHVDACNCDSQTTLSLNKCCLWVLAENSDPFSSSQ